MKNRIQQILIAVIMITCIFVGLHYLYKTESERKFKETFAENKEAFVDLKEKLLVNKEEDEQKYFMVNRDNKNFLIMYNKDFQENLIEFDSISTINSCFSKLTHNANIDYISVREDYIVFQSEYYGGAMIYTENGKLANEDKNNKEDYQKIIKLDKNWYVIYIDLM